MPNWCSVSLRTTNKDVVAVLKQLDDELKPGLFGAFVPIPAELVGVNAGSPPWRGDIRQQVPLTAEEAGSLRDRFGSDNWYDWSVKNWSTKWEASSVSFDFPADDCAVVLFDTAWSAPFGFLQKVIERYPQGEYELGYAEGGMGFWGSTRFVDGALVEEFEGSGDFWVPSDDPDAEDWETMPSAAARSHMDAYGLHSGG